MVLDDAVEAIKEGQSLLLDGFPRTMEQAVALDKNLDVDMVINLCVPNETIIERISDRWIHPASGRVYSYSYKPPMVEGKDDETGEDLVQRDDDKPESVLRRLQKYDEATAPLVKYYEEKGGRGRTVHHQATSITTDSILHRKWGAQAPYQRLTSDEQWHRAPFVGSVGCGLIRTKGTIESSIYCCPLPSHHARQLIERGDNSLLTGRSISIGSIQRNQRTGQDLTT
eukprot:scaffold3283_cov103-Alexandrium_tamarense.AAC.8